MKSGCTRMGRLVVLVFLSLFLSILISFFRRCSKREQKRKRRYTRNNHSPDIRPRQQIRIAPPRPRILGVKIDDIGSLFARAREGLR